MGVNMYIMKSNGPWPDNFKILIVECAVVIVYELLDRRCDQTKYFIVDCAKCHLMWWCNGNTLIH